MIAAIGLFMLPVHLASYRERGVLRRFDVSRYARLGLPAAWILVAIALTVVAVAVLLAPGHLVYGLPEPNDLLGVVVGTLLGAFAFISIGIALGLAMPSPAPPRGSGSCSSSRSSCLAGLVARDGQPPQPPGHPHPAARHPDGRRPPWCRAADRTGRARRGRPPLRRGHTVSEAVLVRTGAGRDRPGPEPTAGATQRPSHPNRTKKEEP